MTKRILTGLAGIALFAPATLFFLIAKDVASEPFTFPEYMMLLVPNVVGAALCGVAGLMLTVWACTPGRT